MFGSSRDTSSRISANEYILAVGVCYIDHIMDVDHYPKEDEKLRCSRYRQRRGGNTSNMLQVLQQLQSPIESDMIGLSLCSVLPAKESVGSEHIKDSLGDNVKLDHCIYREKIKVPAICFVTRSLETGSRTSVGYDPLPQMTLEDFTTAVDKCASRIKWCHFEGRDPQVTRECMRWLRREHSTVYISVELENHSQPGLESLAKEADVVFYSKSWALADGFQSSEALLMEKASNPKAKFIFSTWGSEGASVVDTDAKIFHQMGAQRIVGKDVIDTAGARDTFIAGALYALTHHPKDWDLMKKLQFANELAGRKVIQEGFAGLGDKIMQKYRVPH